MVLRDRFIGFALAMLGVGSLACAGDDHSARSFASLAPMLTPHTEELELAYQSRRRDRRPANIESHGFLDLTPGLVPLTWPKNSDVRARLLTPELRRTPVVGWIAENLYRSKKDNGWCLEVDPGEGEYVVFYRVHLK
jgi:hypothetical protein